MLAVTTLSRRVYPRACGGTPAVVPGLIRCRSGGLSPRLRGNRFPWRSSPCLVPSAGGLSPRLRGNRLTVDGPAICVASRVYPRACGGTPLRRRLKPHGGSNPVYPRACGGTAPPEGMGRRRRLRVYPRACGGTEDARLHVKGDGYPRACGGT